MSELSLKRTLQSFAAAVAGSILFYPLISTTYLIPPLSLSLSLLINRKDQKKVDKLTAQIPYHEGRGNKEEVEKIKAQVDAIWVKTREAAFA